MSHLFRSSRLFRSHYCFHLLLCRCLIKWAVQVCEPDDLTSTILLWLPCGQDRARCLAHMQEILAHKADPGTWGRAIKVFTETPESPGTDPALWGAVCSGEASWTSHLVLSSGGVQRREERVSWPNSVLHPLTLFDFIGEREDSVLHRTDLFGSHQHTRMRKQ